MSGVHEVTAFLGSIGLDVCVQAVVHNGFYTSMEALKGATYEELLDCGVRPMHAKLLLSNLGVKGGTAGLGATWLSNASVCTRSKDICNGVAMTWQRARLRTREDERRVD